LNAVKHGPPAVAKFFKSRIRREKVGHVSPTPPPLGVICAKFEVSIFIHYGNTKCNAKHVKYEKLHMKRLAIRKQPSRTLKVIIVR